MCVCVCVCVRARVSTPGPPRHDVYACMCACMCVCVHADLTILIAVLGVPVISGVATICLVDAMYLRKARRGANSAHYLVHTHTADRAEPCRNVVYTQHAIFVQQAPGTRACAHYVAPYCVWPCV